MSLDGIKMQRVCVILVGSSHIKSLFEMKHLESLVFTVTANKIQYCGSGK